MKITCLTLVFFAMSLSKQSTSNTVSQLPFEPCPETPNCEIDSAEFPFQPGRLFEAALETLRSMRVFEVKSDPEQLEVDAVFRIRVFGFKDDFKIRIEETNTGNSKLYVRSSSRVGYSDLGVNRRRISKFFNKLESKL